MQLITSFVLPLTKNVSPYLLNALSRHGRYHVVINGILWRDLALGVSPLFPSVHIMQSISDHLIPPGGVLPAPYLVVPAAVGAVVVGSFERKMSRWLAQFKAEDKDE